MRHQNDEPTMLTRVTMISGFAIALLAAMSLPSAAYAALPLPAQGRSQEHGHQGHERANEGKGKHGKSADHVAYFNSRAVQLIRSYYGEPHQGLPPGLAKRGGNLPPGLEKHFERDGVLPPGLQKRVSPLPYNLERQLPALPPGCGCRRGVLGPNVLILNSRTGRILDIIRDVVRL